MSKKITISGTQSFSETAGMIDGPMASRSDLSCQAAAAFSTNAYGVNKGNVQVELLNAAGTVVQKIQSNFGTDLTAVLTAGETSADAGSTATNIAWTVAPDAFGPGSKLRLTASGKVQLQQFNGTGQSGTINGNGHYTYTLPFFVSEDPSCDTSDG